MKKILPYFLIFLISLSIFSFLQFSNILSDPDSFYHAKMALLMKEKGIIKDFPWLQFTILKENYINHHFLYHLFLIPFVSFFDPLVGIKIASVFFNTIFVLIFYWFLKKFQIKGAFVYSLLLFTASPFLYRLSLPKAQPLSLIFLLFGLYFILNKNYFKLFILSFLYVWLYNGWPLIFSLVIVFLIAKAIYNKESIIKILLEDKKIVFSCLLGLILGIIINPYFPKNLYFYFVHIIKIGLINLQNIIGVGAEWYPYDPLLLIQGTLIVFILWLVSLAWFFNTFKKQSYPSVALIIFSFLFFLYTVKSRRNVEYFVPFSILFSCFCLNDFWQEFNFKEFFKKNFSSSNFIPSFLILFYLLTFFIIVPISVIAQTKTKLLEGFSFDKFRKASNFLKDISKEKEIVFHFDWDEFPILFYHNSKNYYLVGLDATFMYEYNKDLYWKWSKIDEKQKEEIYQIIKSDFRASYIFFEKDNKDLEKKLKEEERFQNIYQDQEAIVYKIRH